MIQHMNLVFGAGDLSVGEGAFLMACCNHTDAKGYVIASMRQIRDEAHLGESAAKSNKKRLISRGLLASAERYHPKNGARIADLYRVNVDALKQMQRKNTDYGPTLVEELTFDGPQENPSSDPGSESDGGAGSESDPGGADSDRGGSESDGDAGSESDPHFLPSSSPSPLPSAAGDEDVAMTGVGEGETSASRGQETPAVPQQRDEQDAAEQFAAGLPGRLGKATVRRLAPLVAAALADGYTAETLRAELAELVDVSRIENRGALPSLYARALGDLPPAPVTCSRSAGGPRRRRRAAVPDEYAL